MFIKLRLTSINSKSSSSLVLCQTGLIVGLINSINPIKTILKPGLTLKKKYNSLTLKKSYFILDLPCQTKLTQIHLN
jgi:hypothetical protein